MKKLRTLLIPLAALLVLVAAGCNSHASFPYDQELCGNGRLDPGEPCDLHSDGYFVFSGDPRCQDMGHAGGPVLCSGSCTFDFTSCLPTVECNPIDPADPRCPGKTCIFFSESLKTACGPDGELPPGPPCDDSSQCMPASTCVDVPDRGRICSPLCDVGTSCMDGQACVDVGWPYDLGYCPPSNLECDPLSNKGCYEFGACYFFGNLEPTVQCTDTSPTPSYEGMGCGSSDQCYPTFTCLGNSCRRLCELGTECIPGVGCDNANFDFLSYGVCPVRLSCDPVTNQGCPENLSCLFTGSDDGARYCSEHLNNAEGDSCERFADCGPGLHCTDLFETVAGSVCTRYCNEFNPCTDKICAFYNNPLLPGLCVWESVCNPLTPFSDCQLPLACAIVGDLGQAACVRPGFQQKGAPCSLLTPCAEGLYCDNAGNGLRVCRNLCYLPPGECPDGSTCAEMFWPLDSVGVCK